MTRLERRKDRGRVVLRTPALELADVKFVVSEASRQACLRTGRRSPHAFAEGFVERAAPPGPAGPPAGWAAVSYNPFVAGHFARVCDGAAVHAAPRAILAGRRVYVP